MGPLLPLLKSLLPYTRKKLGFNRPPSLFFASDTENASKPLGKTAFYDPSEASITIFVDGRHPKDILRSISHELVHHMQHERGDFGTDMDTGEGYAQKNDALRELEREAYESGNMCFRDWEDENRQALQEAKQHFNKESDKMSAKKKRNDNVESLLMKKWGFKEQTRQEFNIEVPDAKKSVLSEDLARHVVKEAFKRVGKSLIKEAEVDLGDWNELYNDENGKVTGLDELQNRELGVLVIALQKAMREDGHIPGSLSQKIFSSLIKSKAPLQRDVAIKSVPSLWTSRLNNKIPTRSGINKQWYLRQKDQAGEYIFDTPESFLVMAPMQYENAEKMDAALSTLRDKIMTVMDDIENTAKFAAAEPMADLGLDPEGARMAIDQVGRGLFQMDAATKARTAWGIELRKLEKSDKWTNKKEDLKLIAKANDEQLTPEKIDEEFRLFFKNDIDEFLRKNPAIITQFPNPNAAVSPQEERWWDFSDDRGVKSGTNLMLLSRYNKHVKDGQIWNPDSGRPAEERPDEIPDMSFEEFTESYNQIIKGDEGSQARAALYNAAARAEILRKGKASLTSRQTSTGIPGSQMSYATGGSGFPEVYASEAGRVLDGNTSPGDQKIFDLVKDKWEGLDEKPSGDDLATWLTSAQEEAVGQVGDPMIYNTRLGINDLSKSIVPDWTENLAGRDRTTKEPVQDGSDSRGFGWMKNFDIQNLIKLISKGGERGVYDDWAADERAEDREVPDYEEYRGVRDILDARPDEQTKVPQGVQNEDLIRKVVQEALKRKFGE